MKKLIIIVITLLFIQITASSQPCLPNGITFTTQTEIDMFQYSHPNCTEIEGDVEIYKYGSDIANLNGLSVLTSFGGDLSIGGYGMGSSLTSLAGLDNVTSIEGRLEIFNADGLHNLSGLDNLTSVGGIAIASNNILSSLTGLENVTSVEYLVVFNNHALASLTGLDNLTFIAGDLTIDDNIALDNISGLGNLTSIGNTLSIWNNHYLLNLTGLGNVTAIGGNIHIRDNSSLSGLVGLENVDATSIDSLFVYNNPSLSACEVQSICNYLAIPGGFTEIHDNATSCNSREEVAEACAYGLDENIIFNHFSIYPNPFSNLSTFEYELNEPAVVTLMIYNYLAQPTVNLVNENQQAAKHIITWNTEGLPSGIYFYRLQAGNRSASGKMIVVK